MTDYGHELMFGSFITPSQQSPESVVALAQLSEELGLDLVTFQDHPYQPAFLDTWTLMSYVAAATVRSSSRPTCSTCRCARRRCWRGLPPAWTCSAVAGSSSVSARGRSGTRSWRWAGRGGRPVRRSTPWPRRSRSSARDLGHPARGGVRVDGRHYRSTAPSAARLRRTTIEIWLGAYKPRMLRLTGRVADGWLPSAGYLPPDSWPERTRSSTGPQWRAGRSPGEIRRLYNINGTFAAARRVPHGPPDHWVDELTVSWSPSHGMGTFILGSDDPACWPGSPRSRAGRSRVVAAERTDARPKMPAEHRYEAHSHAHRGSPRRSTASRCSAVAPARAPAFTVRPTPDDTGLGSSPMAYGMSPHGRRTPARPGPAATRRTSWPPPSS